MIFPARLDLWNSVADNYYHMAFVKNLSHVVTVPLEDLSKPVLVIDTVLPSDIMNAVYLPELRIDREIPGAELELVVDGAKVLTQDLSTLQPITPWKQTLSLFWATPEGSKEDPSKKSFLGFMLPNGTRIRGVIRGKPLPHPTELRVEFVLGDYRSLAKSETQEKA